MTNLTVDQCKKLKELGFPQYTHYFYDLFGDLVWKFMANGDDGQTVIFFPDKCYSCPTLEELIEWLGDEFLSLHKEVLPDSIEDKWSAESLDYQCFGATPIEAVYNLYESN